MEQISSSSDHTRDELMNLDPEFRDLAREHRRYEARLSELAALPYPTDAEVQEETTLKRRKLAIKDQMQAMMLNHQKAGATH